MPKNGNTMWNGNYGATEQARRDNYDRGNSTSDTVSKAKAAIASPGGMSSAASTITPDMAKSIKSSSKGL